MNCLSSAVLPMEKSAGVRGTDRASEADRSMPSNIVSVERSTDLPTDATLLGVDGEGYDHYLSPYRQTAYIIDSDGQIDREVDVRGRSLTAYGEWVSRTRGRWTEWYCCGSGLPGLVGELATSAAAHSGD